MDKITRPSKFFFVLFRILFYAYPLFLLGYWLFYDPNDTTGLLGFKVVVTSSASGDASDIVFWQRLACFGAAMLPGAAIMYVYLSLSRLFNLYGSGTIFGRKNVSCYRAIGYGLIGQQFMCVVEELLQTAILSMNNPVGERMISVGFDDTNISLVITGFMIILIARIMDEGRKIQEEQTLTV